MARAIDMAVEKAMPLSRDVGLSMAIEIAIGIAEGKTMTLGRAVDLGMAIEIAIAIGMAMFFFAWEAWAWDLAGALMELKK